VLATQSSVSIDGYFKVDRCTFGSVLSGYDFLVAV